MKHMKPIAVLAALVLLAMSSLTGCSQPQTQQTQEPQAAPAPQLITPREQLGLEPETSPDWVTALPQAAEAKQLFVVAGYEKTTAWISLHEKDNSGTWHMIMSSPGYIGKEGLGKTKEGDGMTPVGTFSFNRAFGIAEDPGCAIPYVQADDDTYWSGDTREGMHYNEMVSLKDYPDLDQENSEHIVDYQYQYQYCLNISYNEECTPGLGSAIFLHSFGDRKPYTGGCVSLPIEQMHFVMQHVSPDCVVVIDSLENLCGSF
jgi:L,D-peptidoglycan transpeptidase YkuD (ErfK/YbiS/YcfS/YnhG family)